VELLLSHFKSAAGIERATLEEVVAVVGSKKAAAVKAALDTPDPENQ
jgi:excinuclease UvrABC nuclease subunit